LHYAPRAPHGSNNGRTNGNARKTVRVVARPRRSWDYRSNGGGAPSLEEARDVP